MFYSILITSNICHIMCWTNSIPGQFSLHLPSFRANVQARRQPPACLRRLQPVLRDAARPPQRMVHSRREDRLERRRDPVRGMLQVWQGASRRSAASGHGGADHPEAHGAERPRPGEGDSREPVLPVLHRPSVLLSQVPVHLQHAGPFPAPHHGGDADGRQRVLPEGFAFHSRTP